jgi:membrane-associated protease RseP (regulator of RpoE activity)
MNIAFALVVSLFYFAVKDHYKTPITNYGQFLLMGMDSFFVSMKALFTGHSVSISSNIETAAGLGSLGKSMAFILFLVVFINFNLAFLNIIPFPPLDG